MWLDEKIADGWGWEKVWHEEDSGYWFFWKSTGSEEMFDLNNRVGPGIVWLTSPNIRRKPSGITPDFHTRRGAIAYDTWVEQELAWQSLMENPVPFMIRTQLS